MGQIIDSFVSNIWVQWNDLKHTECMLNFTDLSGVLFILQIDFRFGPSFGSEVWETNS